MNEPSNEDHNWTVCSDSDDLETDLPEAEPEELEECEWSVCPEESDHDRCTEAMDYVNQLIARMNGGESPPPIVAPSPPSAPSAPVVKDQPTKVQPAVASSSATPPRQQRTPEPPIRKTETETAEEKQMRIAHRPLVMAADMQRLREAANLSMKGMLKSLDQKYLLRRAYVYLFVAGGFVAASMILLSMSPQMTSTSYAASVIATVFAGLATRKYTKVSRRHADIVRSDPAGSRNIPAI